MQLEIDDENNNPLVIDLTNRGMKLTLAEKNKSSIEFLVRNLQAIQHILHGKHARVRFGTDPTPANNPIVFEGNMLDIDRSGTYQQYIPVMARDFFQDRLLSKVVAWGSEGEGGVPTIGYWNCDSTFDDFSGNDNHGVGSFHDTSSVFKNGVKHEGLYLNSTIANGARDKVTIPHDKTMETQGSYWFSFWTVHGENPVDKAGIISKGYHRNVNSGPFAYVDSTGHLHFGHGTGDKVEEIVSNTAGIMPANINGSYIHWVCEYDATLKKLSMWSAYVGDLGVTHDLILRKTASNIDPPVKNRDPILFGCLSSQDPASKWSVRPAKPNQNNIQEYYIQYDPYKNRLYYVGNSSVIWEVDWTDGTLLRYWARTQFILDLYKPQYGNIGVLATYQALADYEELTKFDFKNGKLFYQVGTVLYMWDMESNTNFVVDGGNVMTTLWNSTAFDFDPDNKRFMVVTDGYTPNYYQECFVFDYSGTGAPTFVHKLTLTDTSGGNYVYSGKYWKNGDRFTFHDSLSNRLVFYDPTNNVWDGYIESQSADNWKWNTKIDQIRDKIYIIAKGHEYSRIYKYDLYTKKMEAITSAGGWSFYADHQSHNLHLDTTNEMVMFVEEDNNVLYIFDCSEEGIDNAKGFMPLIKSITWYQPEYYSEGTFPDKDGMRLDSVTGTLFMPNGSSGYHSEISLGGENTFAHWYGKLDEVYWFNGKSTQQQREELHNLDVDVNGGVDSFKETLERILQQIGEEFNGDGIESGLEDSSLDYPFWQGDEAFEDIAKSMGCTYYCDPDGTFNFWRENTRTSGITINESQVRDVTQIKNGIANAFSKVIVVGAEDAEGNRIIGTSELTNPASYLAGRTKAIHDKTITSYARAKSLAKAVLRDNGKIRVDIPPLEISGLTTLPRCGETVILNLPSMGIVGLEIKVQQIECKAEQGLDGIKYVKMTFGDKELKMEDRIVRAEKTTAYTQRKGNNESQPSSIENTSNIKDMKTTDTANAPTEPLSDFTTVDGFQLDTGIGNNQAFGLDGGATQSELDV